MKYIVSWRSPFGVIDLAFAAKKTSQHSTVVRSTHRQDCTTLESYGSICFTFCPDSLEVNRLTLSMHTRSSLYVHTTKHSHLWQLEEASLCSIWWTACSKLALNFDSVTWFCFVFVWTYGLLSWVFSLDLFGLLLCCGDSVCVCFLSAQYCFCPASVPGLVIMSSYPTCYSSTNSNDYSLSILNAAGFVTFIQCYTPWYDCLQIKLPVSV